LFKFRAFDSIEDINLLRAKICKMQEMLYYSLELLYKKNHVIQLIDGDVK